MKKILSISLKEVRNKYQLFQRTNTLAEKICLLSLKLLNIKPEGLDASDALAIAIAGINMWPTYSIGKTTLPTGNGLKSAIEAALSKEQRR